EVLIYLNRLSDFLFVAARAVNQNGAGDVLWVPGGSR
ncbi:MAG: ATP:cob(I)alamin adenosyltransferase, partial [Sphingomonas sp.]